MNSVYGGAELIRSSSWQKLLIAWIVVIIVATTAPWTDFQSHSTNWHRINWVPYAHMFRGARIFNRDIIQNLVLYMPFGYCYAKSFSSQSRALLFLVGMFACALSLVTEAAQVFQAARFPSATDVINNTMGALLGAGLGRWCDTKAEK
jgi:glycopeptide antibiotics resistance protein